MSNAPGHPGASEWVGLSDHEWVALHVPRFKDIRPRYETYGSFLERLLRHACGPLAPEAIVAARAKAISSFAEKILRKRQSYARATGPVPADPLVRMTDLCGARVITQTADEVASVCAFIEKAFDIDWSNSEDVSRRLHASEFGYRSVHYIVMVNPDKLMAAGFSIDVPADLLEPAPLKAEVQVRTLLEHAWAQLVHDRAYKTDVRLPAGVQRRFSATAAILEGADREFGSLVHELDAYRSNFGAFHEEPEVEAEIARLRIVLAHNPQNVEQAIRIANLALAIGQQDTAMDVLRPYVAGNHQGVQRALGLAMCDKHWDRPRSPEYVEGRRLLETACANPKTDAETMCLLAEAWREKDKGRAREIFRRAAAIDPGEPFTLCRYLEFEVDHHSSFQVVSLAAPMIRGAMERCRMQIDGRVNLPRAWACLGLFHLLLGEPFDALAAVAQVIRLCPARTDASNPGAASRELLRMREAVDHLQSIRNELPGFDWLHRLVLLGLAVRAHDAESLDAVRSLASWGTGAPHFNGDDRIVILSGGCAAAAQPFIDAVKPLVLDGCEGLSFTVVSGGTAMGIAGLAGDVAEASHGRVRALGYLPRSLPAGVRPDIDRSRYAALIPSAGVDFTPLEPLQGWTDLAAAGIAPDRVKLLAYAGGQIARAECTVALALGARVAILEDPDLPVERRMDDQAWHDHQNVVRLPIDRMTLRAFLLVDGLPARSEAFERAARRVHDDYLRSAAPKEPSLRPWGELSEDLRASNFHQVAYAENILKTAGLGLRPLTDASSPVLDMNDALGEAGLRRLAEMEHGRWNLERLLRGWRYAEAKDVANKRSPYLVPWNRLAQETQEFDLRAIRGLPATFREAGLEVFVISS